MVSFLQALAVVAPLGDGGLWFAAGALAPHPASRNPSPGGTRAPGDKPPRPWDRQVCPSEQAPSHGGRRLGGPTPWPEKLQDRQGWSPTTPPGWSPQREGTLTLALSGAARLPVLGPEAHTPRVLVQSMR